MRFKSDGANRCRKQPTSTAPPPPVYLSCKERFPVGDAVMLALMTPPLLLAAAWVGNRRARPRRCACCVTCGTGTLEMSPRHFVVRTMVLDRSCKRSLAEAASSETAVRARIRTPNPWGMANVRFSDQAHALHFSAMIAGCTLAGRIQASSAADCVDSGKAAAGDDRTGDAGRLTVAKL